MKGNKVGLVAVCAEPQDQAEEMIKKHNLEFTVSLHDACVVHVQCIILIYSRTIIKLNCKNAI